MKLRWILLALPILMACQNNPTSNLLIIHLKLPKSIPKQSLRFQNLAKRARRLDLSWNGGTDNSHTFSFAPTDWNNMSVSLEVPDLEGSETTKIKAELWDLNSEGQERSYPALSGSKTLPSQKGCKKKLCEVTIDLTLQVSAREYDK